ncbi:alpha-L-fucosidase [Ilumatobacter sp.]|uniref:alpha-L-fucosidase n=1 Tax=Ilumatobacter sp. TaxID=1967498 RepID=UPI003C639BDD
MTMPTWWTERRFGLFVHSTAASVAGWAPIGEQAEWYRSHLGEVDDSLGHPSPLVEVLAHHRDRWGHVENYDDFVPLLTFENFDADEWAGLAADAGASYSVLVTKHHDGWTWWDAPGASLPLTEDGPHRNVLAEYAAACERHGIALGTYYSLLDWGDPGAHTENFVDDVVHPQIIDLVERYGSLMLWADGGPEPDDGRWRAAELLPRLRSIEPQIVINDRWHASAADRPTDAPPAVRTFETAPPDGIVDGPWELSSAIGHSFGYNRAERSEHLLTGIGIVALYTEVVAKGGNLLLHVSPDGDGSVPPMYAERLRAAGTWIRRCGPHLAPTTPWTTWGDRDVRYLLRDDGDVLAVDVVGTGSFPALNSTDVKVTTVGLVDEPDIAPSWRQDGDGLHVVPPTTDPVRDRRAVDVAVYRITIEAADRPDELFAPIDAAPIPLAPLLAEAGAGDIVQLGDGVYEGPATVPDGVVLRGLGPGRTTVALSDDNPPDAGPTLSIGRDARLEHLHVEGNSSPSLRDGLVVAVTGGAATVLGCNISGGIEISADDVLVRAVTARGLLAFNADRLHVSRCDFSGDPSGVGVELRGGGGQKLDSNRLSGHLCAVRVSETTGTTIRGNTMSGRWWAIHLDHCEDAHVHGNRISWTMRAVDIDGGTQAVVDGNAVTDGDSGCVVQDGASACEVYGNHWDRCRIGLLAWDAVSLHHQDNVASSLHEPDSAFVSGP